MRKVLLIFFFSILLAAITTAQDYQKFKVVFGAGLISVHHGEGLLLTLDPAYYIKENLTIGLRTEGGVGFGGGEGSIMRLVIISFTANGQYYLSNDNFRPFVGAGPGLYTAGSYDQHPEMIFGIYPRLGFDAGHFSMSADYNFVARSETTSNDVVSYFDIRIGFFI